MLKLIYVCIKMSPC